MHILDTNQRGGSHCPLLFTSLGLAFVRKILTVVSKGFVTEKFKLDRFDLGSNADSVDT